MKVVVRVIRINGIHAQLLLSTSQMFHDKVDGAMRDYSASLLGSNWHFTNNTSPTNPYQEAYLEAKVCINLKSLYQTYRTLKNTYIQY